MAATTYTVVKGDTLSEIAVKYKTTVAKLVELNDIEDPDFIVVGQVLRLTDDPETKPNKDTKSLTSKATISLFGLQANTDRTIYATWVWSQENTENYQTMWYYATGDGVWFVGSDSTTEYKQATYSAPDNATKIKFKVKPISKKRTVKNKETAYWTAAWSTEKIYNFSDNPPSKPNAPSVEIEDYKLTAKLDNIDKDIRATGIQFQIVKDNKTVFNTGKATITTNHAAYSCTVSAGSEYKVRCRSYKDDEYSEWSEYSDNIPTIPSVPSGITAIRAGSETSVYLEWASVASAETYDIEYTTKKEYFDGSDQTTTATGIKFTHYEKTGLETGNEYFFRVRAVNEKGESAWSAIKSIVLGKDPASPTTWSSTTTVKVGEPLNLYWVHNAEDGSSQTFAELEITINGEKTVHTIQNTTDEEEKDKTSVYTFNTSGYKEGAKIKWRVRTSGVTKVYGDWSIERTVDVYAPPTLEFTVLNAADEMFDILESFPIKVSAIAGPNTQRPIGYYLTVTANESYETVDYIGNFKMVNVGEIVYSKYFDIEEELSTTLSAGDLTLENNVEYTISCVVSMDSGLTADSFVIFKVAWTDDIWEPTAEIGIDHETLTAYIRPYCEREDTMLSVYRREFDGSFTELAIDLANTDDVFITDPHPALDFARYRIVARAIDTGIISYYDIPGVLVDEHAVVIQWDEQWSNFDTDSEDTTEEVPWSGSMLKLPYNIDVSDKYSNDVSLIEYIGRKRPVSYYGTHLGESSSWKVDIAKSDTDTLYALRRLAIWMGDVYVREPSGTGYWANISVSFSQTHCQTVIPVTLDVKRVEGGA